MKSDRLHNQQILTYSIYNNLYVCSRQAVKEILFNSFYACHHNITFDISDHFKVSLSDFVGEKTIQLQNRRWTNAYRRKAQHPGCYAIYAKDKCLYVGKGGNNPCQRILHHFRSPWSSQTIDETLRTYDESDIYLAFWLCSRLCAEMLEYYLIDALKPTLNNQGKIADSLTTTDRMIFKEIDRVLANTL